MHYILYIAIYLISIGAYTFLYKLLYRKKGAFSIASKILLCLIVIVISGIRCNFGSDFYSYYRQYNVISDQIAKFGGVQNFMENNIQVGFPYLMHIMHSISESPFAIFMACATIIYPLIFHWIEKRTNNKVYSISLFFLFGLFDITNNILKQSIALSILLYAFDAIIEKKYIKFIILSIIATLFHISSILVALTMVIACLAKFKQRHINWMIIIGLVLFGGYTIITNFITTQIDILNRYNIYSSGRDYSIPFVVTSIVYTLIFIYYSKKLIENKALTENDKKRTNIIVIGVIFSILSLKYISIIRLSYIALLQLTILIPKISNMDMRINIGKLKISRYLLIAILFFTITSLTSGNNRYYNYSTNFDSIPHKEWYR